MLMTNGWETGYRNAKGIAVDYDSVGSTEGITKMIDKAFAIGFTHAALTEDQKKAAQAKSGDVLHIPVVHCAVVPVYNLKELKGKDPKLQFTGDVLADIFLGKIDKWSDPALKAINPGVALPDTKITVVELFQLQWHKPGSVGSNILPLCEW
jgi:phosphate transport system substrate-binding protein